MGLSEALSDLAPFGLGSSALPAYRSPAGAHTVVPDTGPKSACSRTPGEDLRGVLPVVMDGVSCELHKCPCMRQTRQAGLFLVHSDAVVVSVGV